MIDQDEMLHFLHSIHNKIRNAKGIKLTGMAALNEINNFFALYFIKDKVVQFGLPKECSFDNIYETYATDNCIKNDKKISETKYQETSSYKLWHNVFFRDNRQCVMAQICGNLYFQPYFRSDATKISAYNEQPRGRETIQEIINMIYKKFKDVEFTYKTYDALGAAYERFKTDEISNSGKHTGQHFTPIAIKKIIIDELKPTHDDIYYEPCAGSGGFIHTACHYVYENDKKNLEKFKENIHANEINSEIQKPLMINMLLHDIPVDNINVDNECDSLSIANCRRYKNKFTKCGTNVPFGVKTELTSFTMKINSEEINYWDPVTNGKHIIKESTAHFIVHIYHCLKSDGVAGIVIDRGILNNGSDGEKSWQVKFRKWLLENNDLYKVILLPTGIFDYTNFATAIIFFKKGSKTKNVEFYEASFIDQKKKKDVEVNKKPVKVLNIDDIKKQNWSLKLEVGEKEEIKKGWVKLGDVCHFINGFAFKSKLYTEKGIPIVTIKHIPFDIKKHHDFYEENKKYKKYEISNGDILIALTGATVGKIGVYNDNKKAYLNQRVAKVLCVNISNKYFYYLYLINGIKHSIVRRASGTAQPNISTDEIKEIKIPDLSKEHQQEIVDFLDKQFELYDINKLGDKLKDIKLFDLLIEKQYDFCSDALHLIYRKIETDALVKSMDRDKKIAFNTLLNLCEYETVKLGDIVDNIFRGKPIDEKEKNGCKYPYFGSNGEICKIDKYMCDGNYILVGRMGSAGKINTYEGKFYPSEMVLCMKPKEKIVYFQYLENFMRYSYKPNIKFNGIPGITKFDLEKSNIKLPILSDQQKIIDEIEKIDKVQLTYKQYGDTLQNLLNNLPNAIKKLIESNNKIINKSVEKLKESSESSEEERPKKVNEKKIKESSESSEEERPKKVNKKKIKESSESSEEERPKKVNKKKLKESSESSEEERSKKVNKKKLKESSESSEEEERPKKVNKKK